MEVWYLPEAAMERSKLEPLDRVALDHAVEKLEVSGRGPRSGRSRFRAFYRQVGFEGLSGPTSVMLIGAVGPEAKVDRSGFNQAVKRAAKRLNAFEEDD